MDEKYKILTNIRIAGLMSEEDSELLAVSYSAFKTKEIDKLFNKYKAKEAQAEKILNEDEETPEKAPEDEGEAKIEQTKPDLKLYNNFRKTLRYEMFKESVLIEHNHTCFICKMKFPSKYEFKDKHPKSTYPLFVRCAFDIPRYIEKNYLGTVGEIMKNPDIFDKTKYLPICTVCKPSRFAK